MKAWLQLRKGPPVWQVYLDLIKLMCIPVRQRPETTSVVYTIAPFVTFACYALVGLATPPLLYLHFFALDLVMVIYLLGLARFILSLAGMDTGAPFGGMGSSREMFMNVLAEPLLLVIVLALTLQFQTTSADSLISNPWPFLHPSNTTSLPNTLIFSIIALLFLWFALAFVAIVDNGLLPVDNPATHLELTMIQRVLLEEYYGRYLGLIEWGEAMRLTFFLTLLGDLLLPRFIPGPVILTGILGLALFLGKLFVGIIVLALYEATRVKTRFRQVIRPWFTMLFLAIAAVALTVIPAIVARQ
jgi:formate hydrogenlyase subunit 4